MQQFNTSRSSGQKGRKVSDSFIESLRKVNSQNNQDFSEKPLEHGQELSYRKGVIAGAEKIKQEEKLLFSQKERALQIEVDQLRLEIKQLVKIAGKIKVETEKTISQPSSETTTYLTAFLRKLKTALSLLVKSRQNAQDAVSWLEAWNSRSKKKGHFWSTFASKKGGSKFFLSSEHYLTRSAG